MSYYPSCHICHIEIASQDPRESAEFFRQIFGWKILSGVSDDFIYWVPGSGPGGVFSREEQVEASPGVLFFTEVDDIDSCIERAVELGGSEVLGKTEIPGHGWYGKLKGPDGHIMGLFTPRD